MTAENLHHLFGPTTHAQDAYEGGFTLRRPADSRITGAVRVESRHGDIDVTLSSDGDRGTAQVVQALEPTEARELALALELAAAAAETAREKED